MKWLDLAEEAVRQHLSSKVVQIEAPPIQVVTKAQEVPSGQPEVVRFRLSTLKRVVHGTEKIAQMFNNASAHKLRAEVSNMASHIRKLVIVTRKVEHQYLQMLMFVV